MLIKIISKVVVIITTINFIIGCATKQLPIPKVEFPPASAYIVSVEQEGVLITIDPLVEKRIKKQFPDLSLLPEDILPVFVIIENRNSAPFYIPMNSFTLVKKGNKSIKSKELGVMSQSIIEENLIKSFGFNTESINSFIASTIVEVLFAPHVRYENEKKIISLLKKQLKEKTLSYGESTKGFVFFKLLMNDKQKVSSIQAKAIILETGETITFSIPCLLY